MFFVGLFQIIKWQELENFEYVLTSNFVLISLNIWLNDLQFLLQHWNPVVTFLLSSLRFDFLSDVHLCDDYECNHLEWRKSNFYCIAILFCSLTIQQTSWSYSRWSLIQYCFACNDLRNESLGFSEMKVGPTWDSSK